MTARRAAASGLLATWGFRQGLAVWLGLALWLWLGLALPGRAAAPLLPSPLPNLPALGLAADGVTVSGLSSGAYMAGQFQIAHAASVAGAALLAGGP